MMDANAIHAGDIGELVQKDRAEQASARPAESHGTTPTNPLYAIISPFIEIWHGLYQIGNKIATYLTSPAMSGPPSTPHAGNGYGNAHKSEPAYSPA